MAEVYKITNILTNKSYIGFTSKSVLERFNKHVGDAFRHRDNRKFYNAIRKYGKDCWTTEVLFYDLSIAEAKDKEIEMISFYDTYNNGYNATLGGDGNNGIIMSKHSNQKRSIALKGIPKQYDRMLGKTHTKESKEKISNSHKGMSKPWVKWTHKQIEKRAMTRRSITEDQYNSIQDLKNKGYSLKDISKKINLSYDMTKKWAKKDWNII